MMTKFANLALFAILRVSALGQSFDLQACSDDDCSVGEDAHSVLQTRASVRAELLLADSTQKKSSSLAIPLLQQIQTMAELASADRNMTLMKTIMQMLSETLLPGLENSTREAQNELDVANQRIATCNSDTQTGQKTVDSTYKDATDAAETTHEQCRVSELQKAVQKKEKCDALEQFKADLKFPCGPGKSASTAEQIAHMETYQEWYTKNLPILKNHDKECNDSTAALDSEHEKCVNGQSVFESHFCEYRGKLLDLEKTSTTCFETSKTAYESLVEAKKQMQKDTWVVEYLAMKKIECFLQVWLSDDNVTTVNKSVPAKCSKMTVENLDMTPVTLKYDDAPPAQVVSIDPVLEYPGSSGFADKYYTQKDTIYNDVDECVATTTTTTEATTTTTTTQAADSDALIKWTNRNHASLVGSSGGIKGSGSWGSSYADSTKTIPSADSSSVGVEFKFIPGGSKEAIVGLSCDSSSDNDIIHTSSVCVFYIYQHVSSIYTKQLDGGISETGIAVNGNDVWQLRLKTDGHVEYVRNGAVFMTSSSKIRFPIKVHASFNNGGEVEYANFLKATTTTTTTQAVPVDLSTGQESRGSSNYGGGAVASKANDGNFDRSHPNQFHSAKETNAWWAVALKSSTTNPKLKFFARNCCTSDYGHKLRIYITDSFTPPNFAKASPCLTWTGISDSSTQEGTCNGDGSHIFVVGNGWVELPEIVITGPPQANQR